MIRSAFAALTLLASIPAAATVAPGSAPDTATGLYGHYADNAFAKILDGRLKAVKVYEDREVLAFMNIHPLAPGDLLVIPTGHYRNLMDIPPDVLAHLMKVAQRIAKAQATTLHPAGIFIRANSGEAAGQTVFHFHLHVTPVYRGVALARPSYADPPASPAELEKTAAKIRAALSDQDCNRASAKPTKSARKCAIMQAGRSRRHR